MEEVDKVINILGENWKIEFTDNDTAFEEADGYCDDCLKTIVIKKISKSEPEGFALSIDAQIENQKRVLRHEIVHAFLYESGLGESANPVDNWAINEEMVDWIARQFHKMEKVYNELKI